jgi:hypothetical protein
MAPTLRIERESYSASNYRADHLHHIGNVLVGAEGNDPTRPHTRNGFTGRAASLTVYAPKIYIHSNTLHCHCQSISFLFAS